MNITQELLRRGVNPDRYRVWLSNDAATFPLYDFSGMLRGFQQYLPCGAKKDKHPSRARYFTWSSTPCLWGLERLPQHGTVFITESIFKAAALHNIGVHAVSANGSDIPRSIMQNLALLPHRFVTIGDADKAGKRFSQIFEGGFTAPDLDELPEAVVRYLLYTWKRING